MRALLDQDDFGGLRIAPLIDIVFLLLIFFLVATTFYEEEKDLALRLAEATEGKQPERADRVHDHPHAHPASRRRLKRRPEAKANVRIPESESLHANGRPCRVNGSQLGLQQALPGAMPGETVGLGHVGAVVRLERPAAVPRHQQPGAVFAGPLSAAGGSLARSRGSEIAALGHVTAALQGEVRQYGRLTTLDRPFLEGTPTTRAAAEPLAALPEVEAVTFCEG